jgi:methionyl-tRNA formyltransferase
VQHALISGDQITGVTLFQIDEGLDTGPILATANCEIQANDNSGDLLARLTHLGVSVLLEHIPRIESGLFSSTPQAPTGITFAPKLSRQDGKVDFSSPSSSLQSKIRGTTPEPGAWTTFDGQTLKILSAQESTADLGVGVVANIDGKVLVGCGEGALELSTVQPSGKKPMNAADWLRGLKSERVKLGDDD